MDGPVGVHETLNTHTNVVHCVRSAWSKIRAPSDLKEVSGLEMVGNLNAHRGNEARKGFPLPKLP